MIAQLNRLPTTPPSRKASAEAFALLRRAHTEWTQSGSDDDLKHLRKAAVAYTGMILRGGA